KRENQKHLGGPTADAFDLDQGLDDGLVRQAAEPIQRHGAVADFAGEIQEIGCLLPRNTDGSQCRVGLPSEVRGRKSFGLQEKGQAATDSSGSRNGDLLRKDRTDQSAK